MTLVATIATVRPLLRGKPASVAPRARHDAEVYRAQLAELEADRARGTIGAQDAATAHAEIARRLLKADEGARTTGTSKNDGRTAVIAGLFVALILPAATFLFYDRAGSPEIGDMPLASREGETAPSDITTMVAAIERRLAQTPDDAKGWSVVAPVYLRLGEPDKAVAAFRNVLRLAPPTAETQAGLGEALVQQANGRVTDEARQAFDAALKLDPASSAARFYLALGLSQTERFAEARDAWSALVASSPRDAPWLGLAEAALADARLKLGETAPTAPTAPGPSAADVAAADQLGEADRRAMIEGMVSQLSARLEASPADAEGWKRLMRSYVVLDQGDKALAAGQAALGTFPPETTEGKDILAFARSLGLALSGDAATR